MKCHFCPNDIPEEHRTLSMYYCQKCRYMTDIIESSTDPNRAVIYFKIDDRVMRWTLFLNVQEAELHYFPDGGYGGKHVIQLTKIPKIDAANVVEKTRVYLLFM